MSVLTDRHKTLIDCAVLEDSLRRLRLYSEEHPDADAENALHLAEQATAKLQARARNFEGMVRDATNLLHTMGGAA